MKSPQSKGLVRLPQSRPPNLKRYLLSLLCLPVVLTGSIAVLRTIQWQSQESIAPQPSPRSAIATEDAPIVTHFNLSFTPVCRQGRKLGVQLTTSSIDASDRVSDFEPVLAEIATLWKDQMKPVIFPQIHGRARLARVPVIMYHDILAEKQVFFDVTPAEFESALQLIQQKGLTPIALDQLVEHLKTGIPLPSKPIVLMFDDGYQGHYDHVYRLLKQYNYPGAFAIYPAKVGTKAGRSSLTWTQLKEMVAHPLVTIASHSVTHPPDLTQLSDEQLKQEVVESKRILEQRLGRSIQYFVYPTGKYDDRVKQAVQQAGYIAAWTMNDDGENRFTDASQDLLSLERIGQSQLATIIDQAESGPSLSFFGQQLDFYAPVQLHRTTINQVPLVFATGGKPVTIHTDRRTQVREMIAKTKAVAAVNGGFFSLESIDSNQMVGPVLSQTTGKFIPGHPAELQRIKGRPLVLMSDRTVQFVPFDPSQHNSETSIQQVLPGVTDAFVGAAWLVKGGQPQPAASFGNLFDFDAERDRAFWGIDWADRPVVGVSGDFVDSVTLGEALSRAGLKEAVMVDSGASASLVYQGQSMMSYEPRPVPHAIALMPPDIVNTAASCRAK